MRFSLKTSSDKQPNPKYTPPATVQNHIADPGKMVPKNADRIRAMTDEELASLLMRFRIDAFGSAKGLNNSLPNSVGRIEKWLKQPSEGD
ncbi:MAG: hypothetical protein J6Q92_05075 [Oscillospiraceae bacterium]|nr:hypothetical protein [Oscillospiraceae bacterium]